MTLSLKADTHQNKHLLLTNINSVAIHAPIVTVPSVTKHAVCLCRFLAAVAHI